MDNWQTSMRKSAAIMQQACPIFSKMLNDENLKIMQIEKIDHEVCKHLDVFCGMDYFTVRSNGLTHGVAWRCQWVDAGKEFNSFTIRKTRESGVPTEYEKRKKAIQIKALYPHYTAHAFVDKRTNEIISLGLSTTEEVFRYLETEPNIKIKHTHQDQDGQADFWVIYWADMQMCGYKILTYKQNTGIN